MGANKPLTAICGIFVLIFLGPMYLMGQHDGSDFRFYFETKQSLIEWAQQEFPTVGYFEGDTLSLTIEGTDLFVVMGSYGSGRVLMAVYIYARTGRGRQYNLICFRQTWERSIYVEQDNQFRQLLFKSDENKVMLSLPYSTLD